MNKKIARYLLIWLKSTWLYSKPVWNFVSLSDWLLLSVAVLITNSIGFLLSDIWNATFILMNVGCFFGTIVCLMPRHDEPLINAIKGIAFIGLGGVVGILFSGFPLLLAIVITGGLFLTGITYSFSINTFLRYLFCVLAVMATAGLKIGVSTANMFLGLLSFITGMAIVALIFCLYNKRLNISLPMTASLYSQLVLISNNKKANYFEERTKVLESVEIMPRIYQVRDPWVFQVVKSADKILTRITWNKNKKNTEALSYIVQLLQGMNVPQPAKLENADSEIQQVISILNTKQERARTFSKRSFSLANEIKTLKKMVSTTSNTTLRFASRLALTGLVCYVLSLAMDQFMIMPLEKHSFWIPLSGCLMVMPGVHDTLGKSSARAFGSLFGACLGVLLFSILFPSQINNKLLYAVVSTILIILFLTIKKFSQFFLMISVTFWLVFLLGGSIAGVTRIVDVIIGGSVAILILLIFPAKSNDDFAENLEDWGKVAGYILLYMSNEEKLSDLKEKDFNTLYIMQDKLKRSANEFIIANRVKNDYETVCLIESIKTLTSKIELQIVQMREHIKLATVQLHEVRGEFQEYYARLNSLTNSTEIEKKTKEQKQSLDHYYFAELNLNIKRLEMEVGQIRAANKVFINS